MATEIVREEKAQALNLAASALWDIQGLLRLVLETGAIDSAKFHPGVAVAIQTIDRRTNETLKKIKGVL